MADALIAPEVGVSLAVVAAGVLAYACRRVVREDGYDRRLPLMGVLGAFVFAAQMVNFAIPGTGSSGHIGGGMLLALLVGPWAAFVVMASILTVQCLLFADGGLLALGCNICNLGVWPAFVGLPLYRCLAGPAAGARRQAGATVAAVVVALLLGASGVVLQTLLSGRSELPVVPFLLIMLGIHLPIAVIEGLITAGVVAAVRRAQPDLAAAAPHGGWRGRVVVGVLAVALLVGGGGAWFASQRPDGLETAIAQVSGASELPPRTDPISTQAAQIQSTTAVLPDYSLSPEGGSSLAGILGALVVTGIVAALIALAAILGRTRPA